MKKYIFALLLCAGFALPALGQSNPPLTVTEPDGSPRVTGVTTLRFSNGSVSCSGKVCTVTTGGGGGGTPGGANTQVQYNNAGSFGGAAGFTFNGTSTISLGVAGTSVGAIGFRNATSGTITLQPVTGALGTVTLSLPAVTDTLVGLAATQTLTNKTLTSPVIAQISNTGTLTLPTSTDTLVGRATTDTLSNKTLASPSVTGNISAATTSLLFFGSNYYRYINGTGPAMYDTTTDKILTFNVQSLTDNRTVTWPDTALTVAGINVANSWSAGVKQTFAPNGTTAGINVGSVAGDPSAPANGDIWYNSTTNKFRCYENGAAANCIGSGGGGGITVGTTTITSGTSGRVGYNNAGVYGEYPVTGTAGNVVLSQSPTITSGLTLSSATLTMSGNISAAAWTTNGIRYSSVPATLTDTTSSGTVAAAYTNAYGGNTIAASSSTTFTDYYTSFVTQPTAGTNVTFTRRWALGLSGNLSVAGSALVSPAARTGTPAQVVQVITPADTALTASTESILNQFGGNSSAATVTRQFSTGALTTQRENVFVAPTYSFVGASTITNAATVSITGAPAAGTNATITNSYALRAQAGNVRFDNGIIFFSGLTSTNGGIREHTAFTGAGGIAAFRGDSQVTSGSVVGSGFYANQFNNNNSSVTISIERTSGITLASNLSMGWQSATSGAFNASKDTFIRRNAAAHLTFGDTDAASPVAQTLSVQNVVGGTTNTAGATWTLRGSLGTSQGAPGRTSFTNGGMIDASGTTQQTAVSRLELGATKVLTNNSATTIVNVTNATETSAGGVLDYCVEVTDATNVQYECGMVTYGISNKGGVFSGNTTTKFGNHQNATAGTLTVTFAISGANPGALSVNANSSLTPSTGYPRITYSLRNLTQQAVAVQ